MINPRILLADITALLQSIPELDGIGIEAYDTESEIYRSNQEGRDNITVPVLVVWTGATAPRTGETRGIVHAIEVDIHCLLPLKCARMPLSAVWWNRSLRAASTTSLAECRIWF